MSDEFCRFGCKKRKMKFLNPRKKFRDIDSDATDGELLCLRSRPSDLCLKSSNGDLVCAGKGGYGRGPVYGDKLFAVTTDGVVAWKNNRPGRQWIYELSIFGIASSPVPYKGTLAIGESQGHWSLDLRTGKELASIPIGRGIFATPLVGWKVQSCLCDFWRIFIVPFMMDFTGSCVFKRIFCETTASYFSGALAGLFLYATGNYTPGKNARLLLRNRTFKKFSNKWYESVSFW